MPLMREYTEIIVDEGLLPQVVRELVELAENQNHVEVVHGTVGRVILVHPKLAEIWYEKVTAAKAPGNEAASDSEPAKEEVVPVKEQVTSETESDEEDAADESDDDNADEDVSVSNKSSEPVVATSTTPEPTPEPRAAANIAAAELSFPVPVKRGPGRPRKNPPAPSVSNGEES